MISAIKVANEFLKLARSEGHELTSIALIKLVYITHGYSLAIFNVPLIYNDIIAWWWGPVIPDLYDAVKKYGAGIVDHTLNGEGLSKPTKEVKLLIKTVYDAYGKFRSTQLSTMTHAKGTPWDRTWSENKFNQISDKYLYEYYSNALKKALKPKQWFVNFKKH